MEPSEVKLNLRQKLLAVMADVGNVPKAGLNKSEGGYKFQMAADIFPKVQAAFIKYGVILVSSQVSREYDSRTSKNGTPMTVCHSVMKYRFMDTDSDEVIEADQDGEAFDTSDKSLNKSKTAALKYLFKQTFLIGEEGDDSEEDSHEFVEPPCPKCGVVGAIIKGQEQYGGGWVCWKKKGGCGATFKEKPEVAPAQRDGAGVQTQDQPSTSDQKPATAAPKAVREHVSTEQVDEMFGRIIQLAARANADRAYKTLWQKLGINDVHLIGKDRQVDDALILALQGTEVSEYQTRIDFLDKVLRATS